LKPEKLRLAVGAGPLILDVMAVIPAPVCVALAEREVEFEDIVAFADVVSPPFFPPCDEVGEASVVVVVGCPPRRYR
jgi:hypothetical protein